MEGRLTRKMTVDEHIQIQNLYDEADIIREILNDGYVPFMRWFSRPLTKLEISLMMARLRHIDTNIADIRRLAWIDNA